MRAPTQQESTFPYTPHHKPCAVCEKVILVTSDGNIGRHSATTDEGPSTPRKQMCPGSYQPPMERIAQYLDDDNDCNQCEREDNPSDYYAQTDTGRTVCQLCLEEELDGFTVSHTRSCTDDGEGGTQPHYIAKVQAWRTERREPFEEYGEGATIIEAVEHARERVYKLMFPLTGTHIPCKHDHALPRATHFLDDVLEETFEPVLPTLPPSVRERIEQGQPLMPTGPYMPPHRAFHVESTGIHPSTPTMEIERPSNGAAPPVPPPPPKAPEPPAKPSTKHSRWHQVMSTTHLTWSDEQQRAILGVTSRAEANATWMDNVGRYLTQCSYMQEHRIFNLVEAQSIGVLEYAWKHLGEDLQSWLKPCYELKRKQIEEVSA